MEKTIGVLGASGLVGKNLIRELLENTNNKVVVAGRNQQKLQEMYRHDERITDIVTVDARSEQKVKRFYAAIDMMINCTGPIPSKKNIPAALAVEHSLPYIESSISLLNESEENLRIIDQDAKKQNVLLATGAGFFPGLSRVLLQLAATTFVSVDHLKISVIFNNPLSAGSAVDMLVESQKPATVFNKGTWISLKAGSQRETICFPAPFHTRQVYASPPLDTHLHFPSNIENFTLNMGTNGILTDGILLMHSLNTKSYRLTTCIGKYLQYTSEINSYIGPCGCAMRMDASGRTKKGTETMHILLYHPETYSATASVIAQGVDYLVHNTIKKSGIFTFGEVMNPSEILRHLPLKKFTIEGV